MDLGQLTIDARLARTLASEAAEKADDGGSANLDATVIFLEKGQRAESVMRAVKDAGLSASPTRWLGRGVMVQPPGSGQAGKRYASNEALCRYLKDAGWNVLPYYQMD